MTSDALRLWTIGHSNQSLEDFCDLLKQFSIEDLVDIRRFPGSRKWPHFNRESLADSLPGIGINYHWLEGLGGRRKALPEATSNQTANNEAWRNKSFRNYADYMQTDEFRSAYCELRQIAAQGRTAIMCSESVFWRCHRRLISDYCTAAGGEVTHIFPGGNGRPHSLTDTAVVQSDQPVQLAYPGEASLFD